MRAPRIRVRSRKSQKLNVKTPFIGCWICKDETCIDNNIMESVRPYLCDRVTRSVTKQIKNFIIYETYRCMPLLGDEKENAPDWDVHIVRYHIVIIKK